MAYSKTPTHPHTHPNFLIMMTLFQFLQSILTSTYIYIFIRLGFVINTAVTHRGWYSFLSVFGRLDFSPPPPLPDVGLIQLLEGAIPT